MLSSVLCGASRGTIDVVRVGSPVGGVHAFGALPVSSAAQVPWLLYGCCSSLHGISCQAMSCGCGSHPSMRTIQAVAAAA